MKSTFERICARPIRCSMAMVIGLTVAGLLFCTGCTRRPARTSIVPPPAKNAAPALAPLALILAPHDGDQQIDGEIRRCQEIIRSGKSIDNSLERIGWLFVNKARATFDAGYYKIAEQCALELSARQPQSLNALLLRGHILHNLHRFKEAEPLARQLVKAREVPFDFGLLGDVLMEQGKLEEAIRNYQKMIDLRPDLHSYARGAHVRWLKGDVKGARDLMQLAVDAASPRDPESAAWVCTRLAGYQFQLGCIDEAEQSCAAALEYKNDYPPALLLRGRMSMAAGHTSAAVTHLRRAVELNPLPEYQWAFVESLRATGQDCEAEKVESNLRKRGAAADPRTFALFLATRGESLPSALNLARAELAIRQDVFTHDAVAWASFANGQVEAASRESALALSAGTRDARLLFHAAIIAQSATNPAAADLLAQAKSLENLLLPSERRQLNLCAASLHAASSLASPAANDGKNQPVKKPFSVR
jgi:tetratricopeptide (TPR) repeat protein